MSTPRVSVLLAVYNAGDRLPKSVHSILNQTFTDLELILVDDGSTDGAVPALLADLTDQRLRIIRHSNRGLTASLNVAWAHAHGALLARQDAGDVSRPTRIERLVELFDRNPKLGLASSWAVMCLPDGTPFMTERRPCDDATIRSELPRWNCVFGAAAMFRREAIQSVGGYVEAYRYAQDYDLAMRIAEEYELAAVGEVLYECETPLDGGISLDKVAEQSVYARTAVDVAACRRTGRTPCEDEIRALCLDRLTSLRKSDRRAFQARSLTRWARRLWDSGRRGDSLSLFARAFGIVTPHPRAWSSAVGPSTEFAWHLIERKLRAVASPGTVEAPDTATTPSAQTIRTSRPSDDPARASRRQETSAAKPIAESPAAATPAPDPHKNQ